MQKNSGNRGSLRVCCWIFLAWATLGKIFHLKVAAECLLSPAPWSKCVCQRRPHFWCLDMNKFHHILCYKLHFWKNKGHLKSLSSINPFFCVLEKFGIKGQVCQGNICFSHHFAPCNRRLTSTWKNITPTLIVWTLFLTHNGTWGALLLKALVENLFSEFLVKLVVGREGKPRPSAQSK